MIRIIISVVVEVIVLFMLQDWLLLALNRLVSHLNQTILGFAVREVGKGCNRSLGVVMSESSGLLNAVALENQLAGL